MLSLKIPFVFLSPDQRCLDTFSASGYDCLEVDEVNSLVVSGSSQTAGQLNDMIQAFIESNLVHNFIELLLKKL